MRGAFVLITAAKNEEQYIGFAIQSVLRQTAKPLAWFIVDDGSTDRTAEIVAGYAADHAFIKLVRNGSPAKRSFGAQYRAIGSAYELAREFPFDYVCVQDADIAPARSDYFERLLKEFEFDPTLGITGGYVHERIGGEWRCRPANSPQAVAGGVQMFRRACFDEIGGYTPLLYGGEDWLAQIDAQRVGWTVRPQTDLTVHHYRPTSSAGGRLRGLLKLGMRDGSFASHPVFELFKCARRLSEKPVVVSAAVQYVGYLWYHLSARRPALSPAKAAYLRREQAARVRALLWHRP
ncbi:glycosyltransferase family A protein [Methylibium sp.]|uniref:glycosyltransferase family 2 protein n=1 Tax=Methylibium sp. TaxID=2067992 RepID=UPI00184B0867|nr:glycosyltransferase family A protein [Methylibium sp.]MBA3589249.1 glycosyltransferase family 2 protein [Methylibium sp.]